MSIYENKIYCGMKKLLKSNPVTEKLFMAAKKKKAVKKQLENAQVFHSQVDKFFPDIIKKFDELGIDYFICFGTLLGAVREHDFIKHDDDMELGVFSDQYYSQLAWKFREIGFEKKYRYYIAGSRVPNEGFVEKYSNGQIHFDLFVFSRNEDEIWCWSYLKDESDRLNAIRLSWKNTGLKCIDFKGMNIPAPAEPEKFLESLYGKSWTVPCVYWDDTMAGNIAEVNKKDGRFEPVS